MAHPGIDQSGWPQECDHCGAPVAWQLVNRVQSHGGDVDREVYRARCTANCRYYRLTGDTGLDTQWVDRS